MLTITVARKPLEGTVANNTLRWGTGGLNIDASRIAIADWDAKAMERVNSPGSARHAKIQGGRETSEGRWGGPIGTGPMDTSKGRWPANLILCPEAAEGLDKQSGINTNTSHYSYKRSGGQFIGAIASRPEQDFWRTETGGASRYFKVVKC